MIEISWIPKRYKIKSTQGLLMPGMKQKIDVIGTEVVLYSYKNEDYISLTDIAKHKNPEFPRDLIKNWLRNRSTIEFIGLWEKIHNPNFKGVEFDRFKNESGSNSFVLSANKWIDSTNAIGIISKSISPCAIGNGKDMLPMMESPSTMQ